MSIEWVDPSRCRMWDLHDRLGAEINSDACQSLIKSLQQNGQKQPVLARRIPEDSGYQYELVYGARRLFAARHLGLELLVTVRDIDDRAALIEMDIENRVRRDISPYERGLSYRRWLQAGHFESQVALARSLGVSESQVSRLLRYAELPAAVVAAFKSPRDIREEWAVTLAKCCVDPERRNKIIRRARAYTESRHSCSPQGLCDLLVSAALNKPPRRVRNEVVKTSKGSPFMRLSYRANSIHLILPRDVAIQNLLQEITEGIRKLVEVRTEQPRPHPKTHVDLAVDRS